MRRLEVAECQFEQSERGFTLIELLVVIVIIGVLAGISISTFMFMRVRGFNAEARASLRNAVTAEEALASDGGLYVACADATACETSLPGFQQTENVDIAFEVTPANTYIGTASHPRGNVVYEFDSTNGQIVEQ